MKPKVNYPKSSLKNPLDTVYETPKPDEKKLLARSITFYKDPADSALKRRIAKIFRNDKEICVVAWHPQFAKAKREEKARLKKEKKQADLDAKKLKQKKEQADILAKLQAVKPTQQISEQPSETTESKDQKMQEGHQKKRKFRYKLPSKRKLDFSDEEMEYYFPKESTSTTTRTSMLSVAYKEFKIDPSKNFHVNLSFQRMNQYTGRVYQFLNSIYLI